MGVIDETGALDGCETDGVAAESGDETERLPEVGALGETEGAD